MIQFNGRCFKVEANRLCSSERIVLLEIPCVVERMPAGMDPDNLLHAGSGAGSFAEAFARRNPEVTGIDVNPELL